MKLVNKVSSSSCQAYVVSNPSKDLSFLSEGQQKFAASSLDANPKKWFYVPTDNGTVYLSSASTMVDAEATRKKAANLVILLADNKETSCTVHGVSEHTLAFAEGAFLANYQFLPYFSDAEKKKSSLIELAIIGASDALLEEATTLGYATSEARTLVNKPVSHLNAVQLANEAERMGKEYGFSVEVLNKKKIESLKMGGLLAVNAGSIDEPTFTIMEHRPAGAKNSKPIVLVGKGVVYDTGGLSLKPSNFMDTMKSDMGGAAAVIGAMAAIAKNNLPVHVIGLVPSTDNRPGGNAYAPGDVITMYSGQTVEVLNTDAEGRMILADALHYAKKYDPQVVIDLATLTGAAARAVGRFGIVGMEKGANQILQDLKVSGENTYERVVEFPFWDEYDEMMNSSIADMKNIGGAEGGAITAGKFLARFTDYPYIHLDIAGPAFIEANDHYLKKGATGVGVRLLYDFIKNQA